MLLRFAHFPVPRRYTTAAVLCPGRQVPFVSFGVVIGSRCSDSVDLIHLGRFDSFFWKWLRHESTDLLWSLIHRQTISPCIPHNIFRFHKSGKNNTNNNLQQMLRMKQTPNKPTQKTFLLFSCFLCRFVWCLF